MKQPLFLIVTGLSGSGKSNAMKAIEDEGFFCMDNIPIDLLPKLIEMYDFASLNLSKVCIGIDVRAGALSFFEKAPMTIKILKGTLKDVKLIFLDAKADALLNRFKETRRRHPLSETYPNLLEAIDAEKAIMTPIRDKADFIIDTSVMNVHQLTSRIKEIISSVDKSRDMYIEVCSFGFKKGIPLDADIVMDVRFLPNPHFVESLMNKTGMDPEVREFLMSHEIYVDFLQRFKDLIAFILPLCKKEGRSYLNIAIGCTGGRHRSVAMAEQIRLVIEEKGFNCKVIHRDLS
jgi:UPF0042 nucleotide-binding protein